jgi:phenylpropionate dioxygenase-like ring-hydroxylating dioxygenase large terminal subunit
MLTEVSKIKLPRNCTFTQNNWEVLSSFWHPVAFSHQITDRPLEARLLDEELVLYRSNDGIVVAKDLCLHRGARLTLGWVDNGEIVCGYHGFRFGANGRCTQVPAHPDLPVSPKLCLTTFPAQERYGLVWVCLSGKPSRDLPVWEELEDPAYHRVCLEPFDWNTSAARQCENFLDISHFSWLHAGTFGNREKPEMDKYTVVHTPGGLHVDYYYPARRADGKLTPFIYDTTFPFSSRIRTSHEEGCQHAIFVTACPMSARKTRIFFWITQDKPFADPAAAVEWEIKIFAEDKRMVESQHPEELPLDLTEEFHIRADQMSTAYRKGLVALGLKGEMTT